MYLGIDGIDNHIRLLSFVLTSAAQGFHGISMFLSCFTFKFGFCMVLLVFHFFHVLIDLGVVVLSFSCHFFLNCFFFLGGYSYFILCCCFFIFILICFQLLLELSRLLQF